MQQRSDDGTWTGDPNGPFAIDASSNALRQQLPFYPNWDEANQRATGRLVLSPTKVPSRCGALPDTVIIQPNGPDSWEIVDGDGYVMRNGMMLELPVECSGPIEGPVGTEEDKLT